MPTGPKVIDIPVVLSPNTRKKAYLITIVDEHVQSRLNSGPRESRVESEVASRINKRAVK